MDPSSFVSGSLSAADATEPADIALSRWSNSNVNRPKLCLSPSTENQLIQAIRYASENGLVVVAEGGGNGAFVPVTEQTLYLRMKHFDTLEYNESEQTITVGGGVRTSQLLRFLADRGSYTVLPSSDEVGIVGFVLGGGGHHFIGTNGLAADNVTSINIITADAQPRQLSVASSGDELSLFKALIGAGFGLGLVTSVTMKVYPLSDLDMDNNEFMTRQLVFPASAIKLVAKTFSSFTNPLPRLSVTLVGARAPETGPNPDAPLVILTASYTGPKEEAMEATACLFDDELVKASFMEETSMLPITRLNDGVQSANVAGAYRDINVAGLRTISEDTVEELYEKWSDFTSKNNDAKRTFIAISRFDTSFMENHRQEGEFIGTRDRGVAFITTTWFTDENLRDTVEDFVADIKATARRNDPVVPRTVVNNMRPSTKLGELFDEVAASEIRRIKTLWDPDNLFWSPWTRGF
ncbi:hypothetical protein TrVFT333_009388 [Trichoderma virens FT-333]|nr:hypothetical protein TrVFT333_009388 [Trichoderma virens FT-333]